MRYKRRLMSISLAALMLVSLCAAGAATSVMAAANSRNTQSPPVAGASIVSAGTIDVAGTAACSWGTNRLDLFATGYDTASSTYSLYHKWFDGSWHAWENMGQPLGRVYSAPTAVSWGSGRIDVFVTDVDGNLWQLWFDASNGGWHPWNNMGKPTGTTIASLTAPAASSWGSGRLDVFAIGHDGNLWQKFFQNGWSGWYNLGAPAGASLGYSSPGAVSTASWGYNRVDLFVSGYDHTLYQCWWAPSSGWQWWKVQDTSGKVALTGVHFPWRYAPAVCSMAANRLDVFFVDTNNQLQQKYFENGWNPIYAVGGSQLIGAPGSAVTWQYSGTTRIDLFMPNDDLALCQKWWQSSSEWSNWYNLGMIS